MKGRRKCYMIDTIKKSNELDNNGPLTEHATDMPSFNFREMRDYCKANGKEMSDLTEKEIEQFKNV